ncbi:MAG: hypothetical protein JSS09_08175 [Verrucomicrobia bacterium]|nr:hypothetical protein [Verrucomicrobiota bacterium]
MFPSLFLNYLNPLPKLTIPPSPPSHNEVFVEAQINFGKPKTHYVLGKQLDTTKAQKLLLAEKERIRSVTQLCITHYWEGPKSERIVYKLDYLKKPISLPLAIAIIHEAQTAPISTIYDRAIAKTPSKAPLLIFPHIGNNPTPNEILKENVGSTSSLNSSYCPEQLAPPNCKQNPPSLLPHPRESNRFSPTPSTNKRSPPSLLPIPRPVPKSPLSLNSDE